MGGIDLDPASSDIAQTIVRATRYYTVEDNGLALPWWGRVFLNPPYSKIGKDSAQEVWANKLIKEYIFGGVDQGIMLAKAALGYDWFKRVWMQADSVCLAHDLIAFKKPREVTGLSNGRKSSKAKLGSAFFYFGENKERFREVFETIGWIY
jgi:hypothetical protein